MARQTELTSNTIARIRVECPDAGALQNILRVLEGALGKPASVSKPYQNRNGEGTRVYLEIIVPCSTTDEQ